MGLQEFGDGTLVLGGGEGAGGVDQSSAGPQELGGGGQDLGLTLGAHLDRLLGPVGNGGLLLAEHALAGAGSVHQYPVEAAHKMAL